MKICNKLVRDKIPDIILKDNDLAYLKNIKMHEGSSEDINIKKDRTNSVFLKHIPLLLYFNHGF